jgi:hypothetical protein
LIDSLFARFRPTSETTDCSALGEDPEWNELIAWAGVESGERSGSSAAGPAASHDDASDGEAGSDAAAAEIGSDESEDWDQVIAQAKANTPAPAPLDDISAWRTRQARAVQSLPPADHGMDAWDIALRRAKQR